MDDREVSMYYKDMCIETNVRRHSNVLFSVHSLLTKHAA